MSLIISPSSSSTSLSSHSEGLDRERAITEAEYVAQCHARFNSVILSHALEQKAIIGPTTHSDEDEGDDTEYSVIDNDHVAGSTTSKSEIACPPTNKDFPHEATLPSPDPSPTSPNFPTPAIPMDRNAEAESKKRKREGHKEPPLDLSGNLRRRRKALPDIRVVPPSPSSPEYATKT
jgi:hypothetical protein